MNKSPQYNEGICIYQYMESGRHSIYLKIKIVGSIPERIPSNNT